MPWTIEEDAVATVTLDGNDVETVLRALAEAEYPQLVNYPNLIAVRAYREPPGSQKTKIEMIFGD